MEKNMTQTNDFRNDEFQVFNQFDQQWAVVTAGTLEHFNGCTVSWGSMGNMWAKDGHSIPTITVYIHPARYTSEFLKDSDIFTVSFFPKSQQRALAYIGSHSGRNEDKVKAAGLTPVAIGAGVSYAEASLVFVCRKLYMHQFSKEDLAPEIQNYYASKPATYPDFHGGWQPHFLVIGGIEDVEDKRH